MPNYSTKLKADLVEQFKPQSFDLESLAENLASGSDIEDRPYIAGLVFTIAKQLQDVYEFFEQMKLLRSVDTATGKQLDLVGDMVALTRTQAGDLMSRGGSISYLSDDDYRTAIRYKILANTSNTSYPDLIAGLRMFIDAPIYVREEADRPATLILETDEPARSEAVTRLLKTPIPRAAGVGLAIRCNDKEEVRVQVGVASQWHEEREIRLEENEISNFTWYTDEGSEDLLSEENDDLIVDEEVIA